MEKALKAVQIEEKGEHGYTHDLLSLLDEKIYAEFEDLLLDLNPVYTGFRYPDVEASDIEDIENIKNGHRKQSFQFTFDFDPPYSTTFTVTQDPPMMRKYGAFVAGI